MPVAVVDATRELERRDRAGIGWDGRRLDELGEEVLPLREADVREAAEALLDAGSRSSLAAASM